MDIIRDNQQIVILGEPEDLLEMYVDRQLRKRCPECGGCCEDWFRTVIRRASAMVGSALIYAVQPYEHRGN